MSNQLLSKLQVPDEEKCPKFSINNINSSCLQENDTCELVAHIDQSNFSHTCFVKELLEHTQSLPVFEPR